MFNKFIAFHMAGVNFLCHQFTIFNSFHHIPRQHFFRPFFRQHFFSAAFFQAFFFRKLSQDLEHVLQLAPPQNDIDHLDLGEGAGPSHI